MKLFSLKDYAESKTSAPELIGDISTEYGKKAIHKMAEHNGLSASIIQAEYTNVVPFGVDYKTAVSLEYMYAELEKYGAECYTTECGEVYAVKAGLEYKYLDNHVDDVLWDELGSYGEEDSA